MVFLKVDDEKSSSFAMPMHPNWLNDHVEAQLALRMGRKRKSEDIYPLEEPSFGKRASLGSVSSDIMMGKGEEVDMEIGASSQNSYDNHSVFFENNNNNFGIAVNSQTESKIVETPMPTQNLPVYGYHGVAVGMDTADKETNNVQLVGTASIGHQRESTPSPETCRQYMLSGNYSPRMVMAKTTPNKYGGSSNGPNPTCCMYTFSSDIY